MARRVEIVDWYARELVRSHPDWLFLFGDNMARRGRGGQAAACRGEPNVCGVPTKWRPDRLVRSYFRDADMDLVQPRIDAAFAQAERHLGAGGVVALPAEGLGTGLAELPTRAPRIHRYIEDRVGRLRRMVREREPAA